jgi:hypothetical protein
VVKLRISGMMLGSVGSLYDHINMLLRLPRSCSFFFMVLQNSILLKNYVTSIVSVIDATCCSADLTLQACS